MELRAGYKNTDIGIIPEEWDVDIIDNVLKIGTGSKNTQDRLDDGTFPFFVRSQTVERINSHSYDCEAVLTAGDGVGTGKIFHYVNEKFELHQRVYIMNNFKEKLLGNFFFLYFSDNFYNRVMQMTAKSSVDSVRREMIAEMKIPLPPLPEQTAIAKVLSDTDQLLQALQKKIAKKRLIKKGAMQELLKPKEGWVVKSLGEIAEIATGTTPPTNNAENYGNKYCFVSPADLGKGKFINKTIKNLSKKGFAISRVFPVNSIMVTCIGSTIGKIGIASKILTSNQQINAIFPNDNFISEYLYYQLSLIANKIRLMASEQAVPMINKSEFSEITIKIPTKEEQTKIATILSDMDKEIETIEKQLAKYKQVKQGLMQNLLTGKIRLL